MKLPISTKLQFSDNTISSFKNKITVGRAIGETFMPPDRPARTNQTVNLYRVSHKILEFYGDSAEIEILDTPVGSMLRSLLTEIPNFQDKLVLKPFVIGISGDSASYDLITLDLYVN